MQNTTAHPPRLVKTTHPFAALVVGVMLTSMLALSCASQIPGENGTPLPDAGLFGVYKTDVSVARADGSRFAAIVYSPVASDKDDMPAGRITWPAPAIAFGHGYLISPELYESTLEHLASNGYMVIATRSGLEWLPDHHAYAADLLDCLTFLADESLDPASPWYQQVDADRFGLLGHSMGGGAVLLAATGDARIKALVTLAASDTWPSAGAALAGLATPSLYFYGTQDRITPAQQHALALYAQAGEPKLALGIEGGSHCGFLDGDFPFCDAGVLDRADQLQITREKITAFFDAYLRGLPQAREELLAFSPGLIVQGEAPISATSPH